MKFKIGDKVVVRSKHGNESHGLAGTDGKVGDEGVIAGVLPMADAQVAEFGCHHCYRVRAAGWDGFVLEIELRHLRDSLFRSPKSL